MANAARFIENLIANTAYFRNGQWMPVLVALGIPQPAILASAVRAQLAALAVGPVVPGTFTSLAALELAFPAAANAGRYAVLLSSVAYPGFGPVPRVCLSTGGAWFPTPIAEPGDVWENIVLWPGLELATLTIADTSIRESDNQACIFVGAVGAEGTLDQPGWLPMLSQPTTNPGIFYAPSGNPGTVTFLTCFNAIFPFAPFTTAVIGGGVVSNAVNVAFEVAANGPGDEAAILDTTLPTEVTVGFDRAWKLETVTVAGVAQVEMRAFTIGPVEHEAVLMLDQGLGETALIVDGQAPVLTGDYIDGATYIVTMTTTDVIVMRYDPTLQQWAEVLTDELDVMGVPPAPTQTIFEVVGPSNIAQMQRIATFETQY